MWLFCQSELVFSKRTVCKDAIWKRHCAYKNISRHRNLTKLKETKSAAMNIFQKNLFSFLIICKSRIKLCCHNKSVAHS